MVVKMKFSLNDVEYRAKVERLDKETDRQIGAVIARNAAIGEADMKINAPWSDRTGAARSGLHTNYSHEPRRHTIVFAHSVNYGIWLEVKQSGKYEAIMPAVRNASRRIGQDLQGMWGNRR